MGLQWVLLIVAVQAAQIGFEEWSLHHSQWHAQQQYCLRWCPQDMDVVNLYPESGASGPSYHAEFTDKASQALGVQCCHICTKDCFEVLFDSRVSRDHDQITLTTIATESRWRHLQRLRKAWKGPMAVLFYVSDYEIAQSSSPTFENPFGTFRELVNAEAGAFENTLFVAYFATFELDSPTLLNSNTLLVENGYGIWKDSLFPINALRNAVNDLVTTRFLFPVDVDFIPSENLYENLMNLRGYVHFPLVIPHFELLSCLDHSKQDLTSFNDLVQGLKKGFVIPFHASLDHLHFPKQFRDVVDVISDCSLENYSGTFNPGGIRLSEYPLWLNASLKESSGPEFIRLRHSMSKRKDIKFWEPYVVVPRFSKSGMIPRYNELFVGRILNKVQWISAMRRMGFEFYIITKHFLIHYPHESSLYGSQLELQHVGFRKRMEKALIIHLEEISNKSRVPLPHFELIAVDKSTSKQTGANLIRESHFPWSLFLVLVLLAVVVSSQARGNMSRTLLCPLAQIQKPARCSD